MAPLESYQAIAQAQGVLFNLPRWEQTPTEIETAVAQAFKETEAALDRIAALPPETVDFENTIAALDDAYYGLRELNRRLNLIRQTNRDSELRGAAYDANKRISAWLVKASFRDDVYRSVQTYADTSPTLAGEDAMLYEHVVRGYRRNGLMLPKPQQKKLQALKTRLNEVSMAFDRNIKQADAAIEFNREELEGVPDRLLKKSAVAGADDRFVINTSTTWQYLSVMHNAVNEQTRKRVLHTRTNRAREVNIPLLKELLSLRAEIAALLGYRHWADYRTETRMAGKGEAALAFEEALMKGLEPKFRQEQDQLRRLKAEMTHDPGARLEPWDQRYYTHQLKKRRYNLDTEQLKNYFPLEQVLGGMFELFEVLFALRIEALEVKNGWVDELKLYAVSDADTGNPLGLIYMDLYPRDGKYRHFAKFSITKGKRLADGRYQRPVTALVCNFPPGSDTTPSLLEHEQVETLFHEFGHALHEVLTQAQYAAFSGTSVPRDFVEAPSQMLEYWVNDKGILDRFAADYRNPANKIPGELLERLEQARLATIASRYRRQLALGMLDLRLHMTHDEAVFETVRETTNRIISEVSTPVMEDSAFVAAFGHLTGYDAGYYGYAWANAIAADMAERFKTSENGMMDREIGRMLRNEIYATGGARDVNHSISAFLGRAHTLEPFLREIGIDASSSIQEPGT